MSRILNFLTEISIIERNPQTLPQIRIDDVEAESCLNVTAIICPNLRAFMQISDMCSVYPKLQNVTYITAGETELTNSGITSGDALASVDQHLCICGYSYFCRYLVMQRYA
jgi:hypothetical protein